MNRWWLLGCGVALTLWVGVSFLVFFSGVVFGPNYPIDAGLGMLAFAVAAPSAFTLIDSYRLRRFGATDILAIVLLVPALALVVWSIQQVASPRPAYPFAENPSDLMFAVTGIGITAGIVLFILGAAARRSRRYGNSFRYVAMATGCLTAIAAVVAIGLVLVGSVVSCYGPNPC